MFRLPHLFVLVAFSDKAVPEDERAQLTAGRNEEGQTRTENAANALLSSRKNKRVSIAGRDYGQHRGVVEDEDPQQTHTRARLSACSHIATVATDRTRST
jgi:hypothetical protein